MLEELRKRAEERRKKMEATRGVKLNEMGRLSNWRFSGMEAIPSGRFFKGGFFVVSCCPPSNDGQGFC